MFWSGCFRLTFFFQMCFPFLKPTASSPLKMSRFAPKRKGSSSNDFQVQAVSLTECGWISPKDPKNISLRTYGREDFATCFCSRDWVAKTTSSMVISNEFYEKLQKKTIHVRNFQWLGWAQWNLLTWIKWIPRKNIQKEQIRPKL